MRRCRPALYRLSKEGNTPIATGLRKFDWLSVFVGLSCVPALAADSQPGAVPPVNAGRLSDHSWSELGCGPGDVGAKNRTLSFGLEGAMRTAPQQTSPIDVMPIQEEEVVTGAISNICLGHYDRAMGNLNDMVLYGHVQSQALLFRALRVRGMLYSLEGDFDHAIDDFSRAIEDNPRSDVVFVDRAIAYENKGDSTHAVADFTEAVRLNPQNGEAYLNRGMLYARAHDFDDALPDLDEAIRIVPHDPIALIDRGTTRQLKGDNAAALQDFDTAITDNPQAWIAYHDRCELRARMGQDLDKALADCNTDLAQRPSNLPTLASRAFVYLRLARYDDAIVDASTCISANAHVATAYFLRGVAKLRKGDKVGGESDLAEAAQRDPRVVAAFAAFGVTP